MTQCDRVSIHKKVLFFIVTDNMFFKLLHELLLSLKFMMFWFVFNHVYHTADVHVCCSIKKLVGRSRREFLVGGLN